MLLQHNNARSHTSTATSGERGHLKGIDFTCDAKVQAAMGKWFQEEPEEFYSDRFEKLAQCWELGIE